MTDAQQKFIQLAKQHEDIVEQLKSNREALESVMKELGENTYHQDPDTSLVYKIEKPKGTFTYYRDLDYKRTAKEGERGGTVLAKKEAEEQGFTLKK